MGNKQNKLMGKDWESLNDNEKDEWRLWLMDKPGNSLSYLELVKEVQKKETTENFEKPIYAKIWDVYSTHPDGYERLLECFGISSERFCLKKVFPSNGLEASAWLRQSGCSWFQRPFLVNQDQLQLHTLDLTSFGLESIAATNVAEFISKASIQSSVAKCSGSSVGDFDSLVSSNFELKSLLLNDNSLSDVGFIQIVLSLAVYGSEPNWPNGIPTITELNVSHNGITFSGASALSALLLRCTKLNILLHKNNQEQNQMKEESIFQSNDNLNVTRKMPFSFRKPHRYDHLPDLLQEQSERQKVIYSWGNTGIKDIQVSNTDAEINDIMLGYFPPQVTTLCCLQNVILNSNYIGCKGAISMAQVISKTNHLKSLYLSDCGIKGLGAETIANAVIINGQNRFGLEELDLSQNSIDESAGAAVASMISAPGAQIKFLDYSNNLVTELMASHFANSLENTKQLKRIRLSSSCMHKHSHDLIKFALNNNILSKLSLFIDWVGNYDISGLKKNVEKGQILYCPTLLQGTSVPGSSGREIDVTGGNPQELYKPGDCLYVIDPHTECVHLEIEPSKIMLSNPTKQILVEARLYQRNPKLDCFNNISYVK